MSDVDTNTLGGVEDLFDETYRTLFHLLDYSYECLSPNEVILPANLHI